MLLLEQGFEPMTSGFVSQKTDRKFEMKTCAPLFAYYKKKVLNSWRTLTTRFANFHSIFIFYFYSRWLDEGQDDKLIKRELVLTEKRKIKGMLISPPDKSHLFFYRLEIFYSVK